MSDEKTPKFDETCTQKIIDYNLKVYAMDQEMHEFTKTIPQDVLVASAHEARRRLAELNAQSVEELLEKTMKTKE